MLKWFISLPLFIEGVPLMLIFIASRCPLSAIIIYFIHYANIRAFHAIITALIRWSFHWLFLFTLEFRHLLSLIHQYWLRTLAIISLIVILPFLLHTPFHHCEISFFRRCFFIAIDFSSRLFSFISLIIYWFSLFHPSSHDKNEYQCHHWIDDWLRLSPLLIIIIITSCHVISLASFQ